MQDYDYIVQHRSGQRMQHVDALSRVMNAMVVETNTFEDNLIICQNKDPKIRKWKEILQRKEHKYYEMRNEVIYKKTSKFKLQFYVPEAMESQVLYKYHNEMGHLGVNKVMELVSRTYWFPYMKKKIEEHIKNCVKCIAFSAKSKGEGFVHSIPKSEHPFEVIHIDHYGPINHKGTSKQHVLVVIDACTKFVRLYATKTTATKEVIKALNDYFRSYSRSKVIISDRGSSFTSRDFEEYLKDNNIQHIKRATGSAQANGQVERVNRSLGPMLGKLTDPENNLSWDIALESVEFALNNSKHRMIEEHPSIMLFGINQKGKIIDSLKENIIDQQQEVERNLEKIRITAREKEKKAQKYNEQYVNSKTKVATKYNQGDYVMIRNFDCHTGVARKLIPKFKGPYKVSEILPNDRYVIEDVEGFQQTQIPYKGIWAADNMKFWLKENCNKENAKLMKITNKENFGASRYNLRNNTNVS